MKNKQGLVLMILGLALLASALGLILRNEWEARQAETESLQALEKVSVALHTATPPETERETVVSPADVPDPNREMPTVETDGRTYIGVLEIPALELSLPIQSEWSYPALKSTPCRFSGSAYLNDLIIAGHNYRKHFGSLKNLAVGDEVSFTDAEGNRFTYCVAQLEQLGGNDLEELESGDWDLTLFTCTIGGKARVTVRCVQAGP